MNTTLNLSRRAILGMPLLLNAQTRTKDDLFDGNQVHELRIELDPGHWQNLRDNFRENTWYRAGLEWTGTNAACSIRSRGNGSRNDVKPSLKLSFINFTGGHRFLGLDTLVLTNLYQDATMLKNFLAQQLFIRAGLPAPRFSFARLIVNGEYWGVYGVGEEVDDRFLQNRLGEKSGFLYEYSWVDQYGFEDRGNDPARYSPAPFEPKNTHKKPATQPLIDFITGISRAPSNEAFLAHLDQYMNVEQYLTMLAVESYNDDRDGQTGTWGLNGFYMYRFAKSTQFWFIPWDKDWSFFDARRSPFYNVEVNTLAKRLLAIPKYSAFYREELRRVAGLAGASGGWLENQMQSRITNLRPSYRADARKPYPNGVQDDQLQSLANFIRQRSANLIAQL